MGRKSRGRKKVQREKQMTRNEFEHVATGSEEEIMVPTSNNFEQLATSRISCCRRRNAAVAARHARPSGVFRVRTGDECLQALGDFANEDADLRAAFDHNIGEGIELFRPLSEPDEGDWLHEDNIKCLPIPEHREQELNGHSYPQYERSMISRPVPSLDCDVLLICPLAFSFESKIGEMFMPHLLEYCKAFFAGMTIKIHEEVVPLESSDIRNRRVRKRGRKQYLVQDIWTKLMSITSDSRVYCRLGVSLDDIYHGECAVAGLARAVTAHATQGCSQAPSGVAVCSFARHSRRGIGVPMHAEDAEEELSSESFRTEWLRNVRHTMIHETAHMFNLVHCPYWRCLMNGYNDWNEAHGPPTQFLCPVCLKKFMYALSWLNGARTRWPTAHSIYDRYAKMEKVIQTLADEVGERVSENSGVSEDLRWLQRRQAQLRMLYPQVLSPPSVLGSHRAYIATCPEAWIKEDGKKAPLSVYVSNESNDVLKRLPEGCVVIARGPPRMIGNIAMLPIFPRGEVQYSGVLLKKTT